MDLDIKGEIGHCGHEMYITFLGRTGQNMVIQKDFLRHAVFQLDKVGWAPLKKCGVNHMRHAVFGLDFLTFLCYTSQYRKLNSEKNQAIAQKM